MLFKTVSSDTGYVQIRNPLAESHYAGFMSPLVRKSMFFARMARNSVIQAIICVSYFGLYELGE